MDKDFMNNLQIEVLQKRLNFGLSDPFIKEITEEERMFRNLCEVLFGIFPNELSINFTDGAFKVNRL